MPSALAAVALAGLATRGLLSVAVVRDGRIAWASQGFGTMFRLDTAGAEGSPFLDLVVPEERTLLGKALGGLHSVCRKGERPLNPIEQK